MSRKDPLFKIFRRMSDDARNAENNPHGNDKFITAVNAEVCFAKRILSTGEDTAEDRAEMAKELTSVKNKLGGLVLAGDQSAKTAAALSNVSKILGAING